VTKAHTIAIIGGAGYIGTQLSKRLSDQGNTVTVFDLFWFGDCLDKKIRKVTIDAFKIQEKDLRGFDYVIFLAGLSNDPMAEYNPALNYISNAAAPAYCAFIAKRAGVRRFVFADSCSVYGNVGKRVSAETSLASSSNPYGISKIQGEVGVLQLAGPVFSVITLRKGTVSGYSPRMRFDLIVNTMYKDAMTKGVITVDNPAIWRPILAMSDALEAYEKALSAPAKVNGVFNISSGNFTVGEVATKVRDYFGTKGIPVRLVTHHNKIYRDYRVSCDKARRILKFTASGTIESILRDLDDNLTNKKIDFEDDTYYNIKTFKKIFQ